MSNEAWKRIPGYGDYEASSLGRVRSISRIIIKKNRWGTTRSYKHVGRVLRFSSVNNSGYLGCMLGRKKSQMVHRAVALAFHGKPSVKMAVNHKNGNKVDNRAKNLEWVSYRENLIHSRSVLKSKGKSLTIDDVIRLVQLGGSGVRVKDLSAKFKVTRQCVSRILNGSLWPCLSYPCVGLIRKKHPYVSPKFGSKHMWRVGL